MEVADTTKRTVVANIAIIVATGITREATVGTDIAIGNVVTASIVEPVAGTKAQVDVLIQIDPRDPSTIPKIGLSKLEAIVSSKVASKLRATATNNTAGAHQFCVTAVDSGSIAPALAESEGLEQPRRVQCAQCNSTFAPKPNQDHCQQRYWMQLVCSTPPG